ncbi:MAG: hypothetical protein Ct9H300mP8_04820 [Gammaproteobacteria bacterium]|nr:MAG: hypothetical protein Ct9H300mP8_04820 [Gammaproteobacteria bacterium]
MPDLFVAPQASETSPRRSDYGYSTRQVAGLTGLPLRQIRHFVERGLIEPERGDRFEYRFGFQDLVLLRTARRLLDGDVKVRRAFSILEEVAKPGDGRPNAFVVTNLCRRRQTSPPRSSRNLGCTNGAGSVEFCSGRAA